jgi:Ni,Fe-hydrogenase III large subunit/Ni,Fe-hydrogenase III component G
MLIKNLVSGLGGEGAAAEQPLAGARACKVAANLFDVSARIMKSSGARLAAEWAGDESAFGGAFSVWAMYNLGTDYVAVTAPLKKDDPSFPTLTGSYVQAYRFERRITSLFGITAKGHPDPRPWIKHESWPADSFPLRKSFTSEKPLPRADGSYEFVKAVGEGVFEIPVGPVHAGIIEPGHFRFLAVGEKVLNMEEKLGYVHKGIEKRFESLSWDEATKLAGRVSGDSTVAHALAYSLAFEKMTGHEPPARACWVRALLLERERVANHLADLAAICNDAAFAFAYYQFWNLRERMLRTNKKLFGHRLLMDAVAPGGTRVDISAFGKSAIEEELEFVLPEFEKIMKIYEDSPSLKDRLYNTGVLHPSAAQEMGLVGFAARASGQPTDARKQWVFPPYDVVIPKTHLLTSGDVHARAWVRIEEIRDSARMILQILEKTPEGEIFSPPPRPASAGAGFAAVEGWRGEVLYWVQSAPDGKINRCMVRDPSDVNWLALEQAVKEDMVPDFPLNNKSWNNSYSGNDL